MAQDLLLPPCPTVPLLARAAGFQPTTKKACKEMQGPMCTLSQNGYGDMEHEPARSHENLAFSPLSSFPLLSSLPLSSCAAAVCWAAAQPPSLGRFLFPKKRRRGRERERERERPRWTSIYVTELFSEELVLGTRLPARCSGVGQKAHSTLRYSQAVPDPSTSRCPGSTL